MIHCYTDMSMDKPVLSCGYVITRTKNGDETFIDAGCRILNTNEARPNVDWSFDRGEYRAAITGVRAALDYTTESLILYVDNGHVVNLIRERANHLETYFQHALFSFLGRFTDWHVTNIDRDRNELAHEQARVGLELGRDLLDKLE